MFNKKKEEPQAQRKAPEPAPKSQPEKPAESEVRKRSVSVIGPTLRFKGELSANEDLVIEGRIEGTIAHQEKNLTIGKQGKVAADIHAKIVEIHGEVEGDVRGDEIVKLHRTAVVRGNIHSPRLVLEDGANFSGSVDMGKQPSGETAPASTTETKRDALKRANLAFAESASQASSGGN
jgi:cytoskeletal protein CcmA (bactofilin family)